MKDGSESLPGRTSVSGAAGPERTTFDWPRHTGTTDAVLREMEVQVRRHRRRRIRGAASALVALLVVGWVWQLRVPSQSPVAAPTTAVVSFPTRQVLPDGSVVLLRAGAGLALDFSDAMRRVTLQKGEALFEVAKNPDRPFVVQAGGLDVRAVGTAFAVHLQPAAVEVLVTEGRVAVEKSEGAMASQSSPSQSADNAGSAASSRTLALVPAGHRVVVEHAPQPAPPEVVPVSSAEISDRLAWRIPTLQFSRTPLVEAVAMVNKHSPVRLVLDGAAWERVRLSGAIRADNIDALLQLLESDHGIKAEHGSENEIVLRQSPQGSGAAFSVQP